MPRVVPIRYWLTYISALEWKFWGAWVIANALFWSVAGWTVARIAPLVSVVTRWLPNTMGSLGMVAVLGACFGILIGIPQWVLLRRKIRRPARWVWATAIGYAMLRVQIWHVPLLFELLLDGMVLGVLQWWVLRQQYRHHYWWIVASGLSWMTADIVATWAARFSLPMALSTYRADASVMVAGLVYGMISGVVLIWLFQHPLTGRLTTGLRTLSTPHVGVFYLSWVVMNAIGWTVGFGSLGQILSEGIVQYTGFTPPLIVEKTLFECLSAVCIAFVLWRQWFKGAFWWVIWSGIGAASGIAVWMRFGLDNATGILVYGAIIGFFQWFILTQKLNGFFTWMIVRTAGWGGSLIVVSQIGRRVNLDAGWGAGGAVYGLLTGAWLFWTMRKRPAQTLAGS